MVLVQEVLTVLGFLLLGCEDDGATRLLGVREGVAILLTKNFQMFKLDLEMAEEPEIKLPTHVGSSKKQESSRKTSTSVLKLCQSL